ncbi:MAG: type II toxin-antitoxin system prevent-host-death family antitoxin [Ilumatobacteraceae bacterium]
MTTVGAYEAKTHLSRLLDEVEAGATVTITRHGHPIARLVPAASAMSRSDAIDALRTFRAGRPASRDEIPCTVADGRA